MVEPPPLTQLRARKLAFEQGIPYEMALDLVMTGDQLVHEVRAIQNSTEAR